MSSFKWIANSLKNLRIQGPVGQNIQASMPAPGQLGTPPKVALEKPKRPLTPYLRYLMSIRPQAAKEYPTKKPVELVSLLAERWRNLNETQRSSYGANFQAEMQDFKKLNQAYNDSLSPEAKEALKQARLDKVKRKEKLELKHRLQDLGKPKRPKSPFLFFLESQKAYSAKSPEELRANVKVVAEKWKLMTETDKAAYTSQYKSHVEAYEKNLAKWEERMIRMGNDDLVRTEALTKKTSKRASPTKV